MALSAASSRSGKRWPFWLAVAIVIALLVVAALWWGNRHVVPDREPQKVTLSGTQLERGRYLTRAADCAACHQTADGAAFAGGSPLKTPFGTIYGTNITPHPDRGIGRWNSDEFYRALTLGKAPGGRNLYPAMPYVSYHHMAREDSDLIYGYLMNVGASARVDQDPDVPFPMNLRLLVSGWNLLFFDKDPMPVASTGQSAEWNRGVYLGNVMGHCGECHTPRGALGQLKRDQWLQGNALERLLAPDLLPTGLAARGWDAAGLKQFLHSGVAPQGNANGAMWPAVEHSLQFLNDADLKALSTFMLGDASPASAPRAVVEAAGSSASLPGRKTYVAVCAGCHGIEGAGQPGTMPALDNNSTVRHPDARNLALVVLGGLPGHTYPDGNAFAAMPGFADRLSDGDIADLVNYTRAAWGGQPADVPASRIAEWRQIK